MSINKNYSGNVKKIDEPKMHTILETITLDNVFMNGYYNDLGFLVNNRLIVLLEHQSTINQNMPLRFLMYYSRELERYIKNFNKDIYRS